MSVCLFWRGYSTFLHVNTFQFVAVRYNQAERCKRCLLIANRPVYLMVIEEMLIFMDKPKATSWFELGTILEIQPAYGFGLAPSPPLSPFSIIRLSLLMVHCCLCLNFLETLPQPFMLHPMTPFLIILKSPFLTQYQPQSNWADTIINVRHVL